MYDYGLPFPAEACPGYPQWHCIQSGALRMHLPKRWIYTAYDHLVQRQPLSIRGAEKHEAKLPVQTVEGLMSESPAVSLA